ncbi:MAG TPA: hypothetical protein PLS95_13155, partial [Thermoanaerobaculales bacterium]|nr:hypothetical protein [Thermoanaerobaculales bacterium]
VDTPHGNTVAWRYMPLEAFLDVLVHSRLFFCNSKRLPDKFEGSIPRRSRDAERARLAADGLAGRNLDEAMVDWEYVGHLLAQGSLINCWSLSPRESYALWKVYLAGSNAGVAVRSTVSKLRRALEEGGDAFPEDVFIGKVRYSDFIEPGQLNRFTAITTKHPAFQYESELRLIVLGYPKSEGGEDLPYNYSLGRYVQVDLDSLVERLHVSPFAGSWFDETIKKAVAQLSPLLVDRIVTSEMHDY